MSLQRRKRLEALERRRRPERPWHDPFDTAMWIWANVEAVTAGLAEWMPRPEPELSMEAEHLLELALRDSDRMHARLTGQRRRNVAERLAAVGHLIRAGAPALWVAAARAVFRATIERVRLCAAASRVWPRRSVLAPSNPGRRVSWSGRF
jgi:hypothetical protein